MSRKQSPTTPQPANHDLDLSEEDAYAHLVMVANDHATEADKRKLIRAGLLEDTTQKTIDEKQNAVAERPRKAPPEVLPTVARGNAIRYLLAYANGEKPYKIMADLGTSWGMIQRYRWSDPQFAVAQDYVERERHHLLALKAEEAIEGLMDGSAGKNVNAKAVMFVLERLRRDAYADTRKGETGGGSGKGGGITYNITFQGAPQPNLCGVCVGTASQSPIIDVKSE